jgi:hypothetical protein
MTPIIAWAAIGKLGDRLEGYYGRRRAGDGSGSLRKCRPVNAFSGNMRPDECQAASMEVVFTKRPCFSFKDKKPSCTHEKSSFAG